MGGGTGTGSGSFDINDPSTYSLEVRLTNIGAKLARLGRTPQQLEEGITHAQKPLDGLSDGAATQIRHGYWRAFPEHGPAGYISVFFSAYEKMLASATKTNALVSEEHQTLLQFESGLGERIIQGRCDTQGDMKWLVANQPKSATNIANMVVEKNPESIFLFFKGENVASERKELLRKIISRNALKEGKPLERQTRLLFNCYKELGDNSETITFCKENFTSIECSNYLIETGTPSDLAELVSVALSNNWFKLAYLAARKLPNTPEYHCIANKTQNAFMKNNCYEALRTFEAEKKVIDNKTALQLAGLMFKSGPGYYSEAWRLYQQAGHTTDKEAVYCAQKLLNALPSLKIPEAKNTFPEKIVWQFLEQAGSALVTNTYLPVEMSDNKKRKIAKALIYYEKLINSEEEEIFDTEISYSILRSAHERIASLKKPKKRDLNYRKELVQKMAKVCSYASDYLVNNKYWDEVGALAKTMAPLGAYDLLMRIPRELQPKELSDSIRTKLIQTDLEKSQRHFKSNRDNAGLKMLAQYISNGFPEEIVKSLTGIEFD
ncbi:MAG: hypothetical protein Q7K43_00955 [Candidatus Woesearchaeota archaeon]|nr:hypothetical protein [Candidatus Woesearchaeota archaeon]